MSITPEEFIRRHDELDRHRGDEVCPTTEEEAADLLTRFQATLPIMRDDVAQISQSIRSRRADRAKKLKSIDVIEYLTGDTDTAPWKVDHHDPVDPKELEAASKAASEYLRAYTLPANFPYDAAQFDLVAAINGPLIAKAVLLALQTTLEDS